MISKSFMSELVQIHFCSSLQAPKTKIVFFNQLLIGETKIFYTPHPLRYLDYSVFRAPCQIEYSLGYNDSAHFLMEE